MPDAFEDAVVGLDKNDPTDAQKDLDGDGESNFQEYRAGTDLLNADSRIDFRLLWIDDTKVFIKWER